MSVMAKIRRSDPPETTGEVKLVLLGVMLAMLLGVMDNLIVGTAMPTIVGELGGLSHLSWVVTAYTLTTAVSTPIWGKLGDLLDRRTVFLSAIVIFLIGSALSGAAASMAELIAFRALQGIGAGGLAVGAFSMIGALVPPRERGKYQGMTATVMAVGTIGGPLVGGVITGHLGWRWAFYINLPLGLVAFGWCWAMLHPTPSSVKGTIDYLGALLLGIALTGLVLVTTWAGTEYPWGSPEVITAGAAGLLALLAFLAWEPRANTPILPLRLFASRNLTLSAVMVVVVGMAMFGAVSFLPLFQQTVQGASATNSGLLLLPMVIPIIVCGQLMGRIITRTGRYKVFPILGGLCLTAASVMLSTTDAGTSQAFTSASMFVLGAGVGFLMQITVMIAQNSVELADMGVASGIATMFRTIGGSMGVAVFGALFNHQVTARLHAAGASLGSHSRLDASAVGRLPQPVRTAYVDGVAAGVHSMFLWAILPSLVCFAAAWFVKEIPLRSKAPSSKPAPAEAQPVAVAAA